MTAGAFAGTIPAVVTLDDLAAMNTADQHGHRYELSPEGALSVLPPTDTEHAKIASRLMAWFIMAGWDPDQILQAAGVRIPGPDGDGARIPDLTVWSEPPPSGVWIDLSLVLLVVEIVSPGSATTDRVVKLQEYAEAGIARYWLVDRDAAQTVTLTILGSDHSYEVATKMPLAWLLQTKPTDHDLGS